MSNFNKYSLSDNATILDKAEDSVRDSNSIQCIKATENGGLRFDNGDLWEHIYCQALTLVEREPLMTKFIDDGVLQFSSLEEMIINRIANLLGQPTLPSGSLVSCFDEVLQLFPEILLNIHLDLRAVYERDPACNSLLEAVLYFKGFHAISTHRFSYCLWQLGRKDLALYLQSCISRIFQVDIHPRVSVGFGIMLDHATGVVVGETAMIDDNVSILHSVTLGGTGKQNDDRHPKIRSGVLIGAGAILLGNFEVGVCSKIAAGSVVLREVPPRVTVAGIPAKVIGKVTCPLPACEMDQMLDDGKNLKDR